MGRIALGLAMVGGMQWAALSAEPPDVLDRFLAKTRSELARLPDYVCTQSIERYSRRRAPAEWVKQDVLAFSVAVINGEEMYARPNEREFHSKPLIEMAGYGTVTTGQFATLARNIFSTEGWIEYRGEREWQGKTVVEFTFDIPSEASTYVLRSATGEGIVAYQGTVLADASTLDLVQLDVQAYDIPEGLDIDEVKTQLVYRRGDIAGTEVLMPVKAQLMVSSKGGVESLNRTTLTGCRRYGVESVLRVDEAETITEERTKKRAPASEGLPSGTMLEVVLDGALDFASLAAGTPVRARVARAVGRESELNAARGAVLTGSVVSLRRQNPSLPVYEVGIEFDLVETGGEAFPVTLTLMEVSPTPGLIREQSRMDPVFKAKSKPGMSVLVREVRQGQGVLLWDARRSKQINGLRMKWRVLETQTASR